MKLKIKTIMFAAMVVALAVSAEASDAVWTNKTASGTVSWNEAANWQDGYIGGTSVDDDVNLAYPFAPTAVFNGQGVNLFAESRSFHSVTGIPSQVITRTGENSGSVTVVDPSPFRGVWAQGGFVNTYIANPGSGNTAEFGRVANGANPFYYLKYLFEKLPKLFKDHSKKPAPELFDGLMPWTEQYRSYEAKTIEADHEALIRLGKIIRSENSA